MIIYAEQRFFKFRHLGSHFASYVVLREARILEDHSGSQHMLHCSDCIEHSMSTNRQNYNYAFPA